MRHCRCGQEYAGRRCPCRRKKGRVGHVSVGCGTRGWRLAEVRVCSRCGTALEHVGTLWRCPECFERDGAGRAKGNGG